MSSEYGWTDKQIGALSLSRLIQISSAIRIRKFYEDRQQKSMASWMVRTLSLFIAQGYMVQGENPGIDMALKVSIDDIDAALTSDASQRASKNKVIDPPVGSFERAMAAFGGKMSEGPPPTGG